MNVQLEMLKPRTADVERDAAELAAVLVCWPGDGKANASTIASKLGWRTAKGVPDDRRIRAAARACMGKVVSAPGRPYCHCSRISVDEYMRDYRGPMRSQIKDMLRHETQMTRSVHGWRSQ